MAMDRELAEHLAKDTGLLPEEISAEVEPSASPEVAERLTTDTGVDEAEL